MSSSILTTDEQKYNLDRNWLKQFCVCMHYDLGCIRVGKSYIKLEEHLHISSIARLTTETII